MNGSSSLAKRILVSMFLVGILPIVAMSLEDHYVGKKAIMDSEKGHLSYALPMGFVKVEQPEVAGEFLNRG